MRGDKFDIYYVEEGISAQSVDKIMHLKHHVHILWGAKKPRRASNIYISPMMHIFSNWT